MALYQGGAEGLYKGAIAMYGGSNQFKFHEAGAGWISGQLVAGTTYEFNLWSGDNMEVADGTYFCTVDLPGVGCRYSVDQIALVGSFAAGDDWGDGVEMAFDAATRPTVPLWSLKPVPNSSLNSTITGIIISVAVIKDLFSTVIISRWKRPANTVTLLLLTLQIC